MLFSLVYVLACIIYGRSRDHTVEQLLPVYAWQSVWYTVPTPLREEPDVYRVISNQANTKVSVQLVDQTELPEATIPTPREYVEVK